MHNQNKFEILIHNEYMFMQEQQKMHKEYTIETNERNIRILMRTKLTLNHPIFCNSF